MIYLFDIPCLCEQWNFPLLGTIPEAPGPPLEGSGVCHKGEGRDLCDLFFMLLDKYATFCVTQMEV